MIGRLCKNKGKGKKKEGYSRNKGKGTRGKSDKNTRITGKIKR